MPDPNRTIFDMGMNLNFDEAMQAVNISFADFARQNQRFVPDAEPEVLRREFRRMERCWIERPSGVFSQADLPMIEPPPGHRNASATTNANPPNEPPLTLQRYQELLAAIIPAPRRIDGPGRTQWIFTPPELEPPCIECNESLLGFPVIRGEFYGRSALAGIFSRIAETMRLMSPIIHEVAGAMSDLASRLPKEDFSTDEELVEWRARPNLVNDLSASEEHVLANRSLFGTLNTPSSLFAPIFCNCGNIFVIEHPCNLGICGKCLRSHRLPTWEIHREDQSLYA